MGNAHPKNKGGASSVRNLERRHSLPARASGGVDTTQPLSFGMQGSRSDHLKMQETSSSHRNTRLSSPDISADNNNHSDSSSDFSVDPMAAMVAHHNKTSGLHSRMYRKAPAQLNEEKQEENEESNASFFNDSYCMDAAENVNGVDFKKAEEDDDDESSLPFDDLDHDVRNGHHHNGDVHAKTKTKTTMKNNSQSGKTMDQSSRRKEERSSGVGRRLLSKVINKSNLNDSSNSMNNSKSKRRRANRRASLDSSAYRTQVNDLTTSLEEVEKFLKVLQQKDPEVRQRILMESLQRQAGMSESSLRVDGDLSPHSSSSRLNHSISSSRQSLSVSQQESTKSNSQRRSSNRSKTRRDSKAFIPGMSNTTSDLQGRRKSMEKTDKEMGHESWNGNTKRSIINEALPTLLEKQSAHHRHPTVQRHLIQSRAKPTKNRRQLLQVQTSQRRASTGNDSIRNLSDASAVKHKPKQRRSTTALTSTDFLPPLQPMTIEEQNPQQQQNSKKGISASSFLSAGLKRLSRDSSGRPLAEASELTRGQSRRRKSSSTSPLRPRNGTHDPTTTSNSPRTQKNGSRSPKRSTSKSTQHGSHVAESSPKPTKNKSSIGGRILRRASMDNSSSNHRILVSGAQGTSSRRRASDFPPLAGSFDQIFEEPAQSNTVPEEKEKRSSRRRRSVTAWMGFSKD